MSRPFARLAVAPMVIVGLLAAMGAPASAATIRRSTRVYLDKRDCGSPSRGTPIGSVTFIVNGPQLTIDDVVNAGVPNVTYFVFLIDTNSCGPIATLGVIHTNGHGQGRATFSTSTPPSSEVFIDDQFGLLLGTPNDSTSVNLTKLKA